MKKIQLLIILQLVSFFIPAVSAQDGAYAFVFLNNNPNRELLSKEKIDSLRQGHADNIERLMKEEKLLVVGRFNNGGGFLILNTASVKEARSWLISDPAMRANRYRIEIMPWQSRIGAVCNVDRSAPLISYTFIRYNTNITKFNVQQAPVLFKQHDDYIKKIMTTGNIISEGLFPNDDGGTLIMRGKVKSEVILADPTVVNGIIEPEIRELWVAKGSFCEQN